jgi:acetyltransferase-like isoleucine patch superfamily enzyme
MLHALKGERAVGLYGGIYRFLEAFAPLSAAYQSILLPVLARTADGPVDVLRRLCLRSLHLLLIAGVGTAVVVTFCSASIIQVTLGSAYLPAAAGFSILIWALPPALMSNTLLNLLIARRKQASGTWIVGSTAAFNIVLNLFLIPRLSIVGASVATVASEVLCFGALFVVGRHMLSGIGFARGAWRPLVAGAALASVLALVVPRFPVGMTALLVAAALSAPLYGALLFLMRAVTFEDFQLFGSILPGRPNSTLMAVVTPTSREGLIQRLRRKSVRNLARIAFGLARRRAFSAIYSLWLRARGAHVGRRCTFFGPIEILGDPARIRIGDRCIFHREVCFWTHDYGEGRGSIEIGSGAGLGRRVTINSYERVTIGEGAGLGDGCYVQDNDHGTEPGIPFLAQASHGDPIDIGADVWLGARCIVLKGVSIGAHSVVGAGSVVVKSLPGDVVAVGVPCRVIKHRGHDDREFTARAA